jgi:hypothetical protein
MTYVYLLKYLVTLSILGVITLFEYLFRPQDLDYLWDFTLTHPVYALIGVIAIWVSVKIIIATARFMHVVNRYDDLQFLRVILPRSDSKIDQEKRTEKDFKEKVAIMEQFFRALHEIRQLNLQNLLHVWFWQDDIISFEIYLEKNEIYFYVVAPAYFSGLIEKQITTFYTSAEVEVLEEYEIFDEKHEHCGFYQYLINPFWFPIKTYKNIENDPLNDLTNALSKLNEDEKAAIQIIINPKGDSRWRKKAENKGTDMFKNKESSFLANIPLIGFVFDFLTSVLTGKMSGSMGTEAPGASSGDHYVRMLQTKEEVAKHVGEKAGQVGFDVAVRFISAAKTKARAVDIMNSMIVSFNVFKDAYMNWFNNRRIVPFDFLNIPLMKYAFKHRLVAGMHPTSTLTPEELATMYHFPDSRYNQVPIIHWLSYKVLPPPIDLPKEGVVLGVNRYRSVLSKVRILRKDRTRHQYIIGKSGSGKSVLLSYMARQDVLNGDGVCVVDPHGDLIEEVAGFIPKERVKDTIIFDPADIERPMGLNLLEAKTPEEKDRASLDAMSIFIKLFGDEIFGPRIQHYFRNGCLTLMDDEEEGATLIDVPRLFVDDEFQKYKVSKLKNPVVKAFWQNEMAKTGAREKEEMIPYFSSKFGPFITNTTMRNIIGQTKSAFNIRKVMDEQKILLVNLSKGKIGDINAQLLGLIFVNKINMSAMSRVDMPESERHDFYMYVDEFQNFATDAFATILSEARKYHLALIMAHQYIAQLTKTPTGHDDTRIRDAVFGNVGSLLSFKVGAEDAEYLAKEYAPVLSEQDILGVANYKAYIKLNINNTTSRPFSLETIYDLSGHNKKLSDIVKKYSRLKYGRKKEFVDQEICSRIGIEAG